MITAIHIIAERRISQAIQEGKLQNDAWRNRPLPREEWQGPEDLRMAYKILKNAGYLPPEIETKKEIAQLEELLAATEDEHVRLKQLKKLQFLTIKLNSMRSRPVNLEEMPQYHQRVVEKLSVAG
jgi:hypothetical protein